MTQAILSDSLLWPLLHEKPDMASSDESFKTAYREVNRICAQRIAREVGKNDIIWIHDFHFMLLPKLLREELKEKQGEIRIGFFLQATKIFVYMSLIRQSLS